MSSVDVPGPLLPGNAKESSDSTAVPRPLGLPTPSEEIQDNVKELPAKQIPFKAFQWGPLSGEDYFEGFLTRYSTETNK